MQVHQVYTDYLIGPDGSVWRKDNGMEMSQHVTKSGYVDIVLTHEGKRYHRYLHRLVAQVYVPNLNGYPEVNHLDGDKLNNKSVNLEWTTRKANQRHAATVLGKWKSLSKDQEFEALYIRSAGVDQATIARKFNVSQSTISKLCRTSDLPQRRSIKAILPELIKKRKQGITYRQLADEYGITQNGIIKAMRRT